MSVRHYIEEKVNNFLMTGKKPAKWLGLRTDIYNKLEEECSAMLRTDSGTQERLTDYLGFVLIPMGGPAMPEDGVYIHDSATPREEHPFASKTKW